MKFAGELKRGTIHFAEKLFEKGEDELHAFVRGSPFPQPVLYAVLALFYLSAFLTLDWFGLLLINSDGVVRQIGTLNALRVTGALTTGISLSSIPLMLHSRRLHTYESDENVFFAIAFALSFLIGAPCALVGIFG